MPTVQLIPGKNIPRPPNRRVGKLYLTGPRKLLAETGTNALQSADVIVEAGQRSRSATIYRCAVLDEFTTYQVEGLIVANLAIHGYEALGFDFGEKALDSAVITTVSSRCANCPMATQ